MPGDWPVPRWMARLMLSAGMFSAFAAATAPRRRVLFAASPPLLAAMVISFIKRVKILPRLASSAPFLCLMVAHLEWPDMEKTSDLEYLRMSTDGCRAHSADQSMLPPQIERRKSRQTEIIPPPTGPFSGRYRVGECLGLSLSRWSRSHPLLSELLA